MKFLLALICGLVVTASAQVALDGAAFKSNAAGIVFYVDFTAGNNANAGTVPAPWKTIAYTITNRTYLTRETVKLKRGETWRIGHNALLWEFPASGMILDAYGNGAKPILDGSATNRNLVRMASGVSNTITRNLKLYNAGPNAGGVTGALFSSLTGTNTVEDCDLDLHATDAGATAAVGARVVVGRCDISRCADDGVTCHGFSGVGSSCYIYNCIIRDGFDGMNHSVTSGGAITTLCEDTLFYNNSSHDLGALAIGNHTFNRCRFGSPGKTQSASVVVGTDEYSITFNYCIVDGTQSTVNSFPSITCGSGGCVMGWNNSLFQGNTNVSGKTGTFTAWTGNITLTNCILTDWFRCAYIDGGGTIRADHSIFHNLNIKNLTSNTSEVSTADPLFTSPFTGDFTLQTGSPAINAGVNIGLTTDFARAAVSNPPEVGAYEK